jgi:hypothetical protein
MSDQWGDIGAAAATLLAGVAELSADTIEERERVTFDADRDSLPLTLLVPERERPRLHVFGGEVMMEYPLVVARITAGNLEAADVTNHGTFREAREAIRKALFVTTLEDAPDVYDCDYDPDPVVQTEGLDRLLRVSLQRFTYVTCEDRN